MNVSTKWTVGLLSLGLALAPVLSPAARAEDQPKNPPAKEGGQGGQGGQGRGQRNPGTMLDRFHEQVTKLNLTDDQKPKIEAAFAEAKPKLEAAIKDANGDRTAIREKVQPIMQDLRTKVEAVLTQDQKDQLQKAREQAGQGRGQGRRNGGNQNGGQKPQTN